ncbi:MAG: topoisomerase DNA-binding C4 zinc finger domain-containing protein, partial [Cereibacter changlensis]
TTEACPSCSDGWLVERAGRFGQFQSCVRFPACEGKGRKARAAR